VKLAKNKKVGDPLADPTVENGPQISEEQLQKILSYV
jgi:acyl-CoA reductase-like NAD-dependent aldehyde dehydrogenase